MSDGLLAETPEEKQFFESGGEKAPEQAPAEGQQQEQQTQQPEGGQREQQKPEGEKPKPGYVPHQALHQERERRKQLENELAEFRAFKAQIEAEKAKQAKPALPDKAADPIGYFEAKTDLTAQELNELRQWKAKAEEERGKAEAEGRFRMQIASHERTFVKDNPDYTEAMEYIRARRDMDLEHYGVSDPAQRAQIIQNEAMGLAWNAIQGGANPAEKAYALAKLWGYKPKQQKADERLETLRKGGEAAKSLSGKGSQTANDISPEDLLGMSDDEFDKAWDKLHAKK